MRKNPIIQTQRRRLPFPFPWLLISVIIHESHPSNSNNLWPSSQSGSRRSPPSMCFPQQQRINSGDVSFVTITTSSNIKSFSKRTPSLQVKLLLQIRFTLDFSLDLIVSSESVYEIVLEIFWFSQLVHVPYYSYAGLGSWTWGCLMIWRRRKALISRIRGFIRLSRYCQSKVHDQCLGTAYFFSDLLIPRLDLHISHDFGWYNCTCCKCSLVRRNFYADKFAATVYLRYWFLTLST